MAHRPSPARLPAQLLREARPLKLLLNQAQRLDHLQRLLESQLQPAAREYCRVASWRDGTLMLVVTDAHWATRMRYQQRRLLRDLQQLEPFRYLTRILFRIQPHMGRPRPTGPGVTRSETGSQSIQATADGIGDPALRAALERLARHVRSDEK